MSDGNENAHTNIKNMTGVIMQPRISILYILLRYKKKAVTHRLKKESDSYILVMGV